MQERRKSERYLVLSAAMALCMLGTSLTHAQSQAQRLQTVTQLGAWMHNLNVEVALTPAEHQIGLMHRPSMGTNDGMLFVFNRPAQQCFWMKNTLIPLDVAFIADDGTIINLDVMQPQTLDNHCSSKPVRFVLEMNKNWFSKRGIKAGFKLSGAPFGTPR